MYPIKQCIAAALVAGGISILSTGSALAQGACGVPVQVKGAQSVLPPVTVADGQDVRVHLRNNRAQEIRLAVAYFVPGGAAIARTEETTLAPGENLEVDMASSCIKICVPGPNDEPFPVQAVVSVVYEQPVTAFKNPAGFDDPVFGFDDPVFGFDDPVFGFDDPILAFDDPVFGFEVFDSDTGRTAIWGSGGVATTIVPADRF